LQGRVTVLPPSHTGSAGESALTPGQQLPEGSRLHVAPDAFVSVRLADGSLLKVQADSTLLLQQLRRKGRTGSLQSVVELQNGAVEATVPPNKAQPAALDVRTGTATSSVRGTQFGVYLAADGSTATAVQQGAVQVASHQSPNASALVSKGRGAADSRRPAAPGGTAAGTAPGPVALPGRRCPMAGPPLPAPTQGAGYVVQVTQDAAGQQVLRNGRFAGDKARFAAVPDGSYFARAGHGRPWHSRSARPGPLKVKAHPVPPLYQTAPAAQLPTDGVDLRCTPVPACPPTASRLRPPARISAPAARPGGA
jgi:hypothetical protein